MQQQRMGREAERRVDLHHQRPCASTAATATIVSQGGREVARAETEAEAMAREA